MATRAPSALAMPSPIMLTPPVPDSRTWLPGPIRASAVSALQAASPATGRHAASSNDTASGIGNTAPMGNTRSSHSTPCAGPPRVVRRIRGSKGPSSQSGTIWVQTRSPGAMPPSPSPTSTITPAASLHGISGSGKSGP